MLTGKAFLKPAGDSSNRKKLPMAFDAFVALCRAHQLPEPTKEYPFAREANRRFRADYCWVPEKVILEVNGGLWRTKGAHNTGRALLRDYTKSNLAQRLGYVYLQCAPEGVTSGRILEEIGPLLQARQSHDR